MADITAEWGKAKAVLTLPDHSDHDDADVRRWLDVLEHWLSNPLQALIIPSGATLDVYGVPKAGGCGVSVTYKVDDTEFTYSAPTVDELFTLMDRHDRYEVDCRTVHAEPVIPTTVDETAGHKTGATFRSSQPTVSYYDFISSMRPGG